ncbi:hypothetical protein AVEN_252282-1 [Araneus ventricosus]|uniref:Uncharacterized protein n=1 Tax=Araneus ventricosus TaxID=182803 RepID=A0A4Y2DNZ5_ARAVE|nr:hypothetical protein AVEN_252282-1 [Araneus ventricosus]
MVYTIKFHFIALTDLTFPLQVVQQGYFQMDVQDSNLSSNHIDPKGQGRYLKRGKAHTRVTPVMPIDVPGTLNDSRCDNSNTEAGVLVAIAGHGPTPSKGGRSILGRVTRPTPLLYPPGNPASLSGGFSSANSWCSPVGVEE